MYNAHTYTHTQIRKHIFLSKLRDVTVLRSGKMCIGRYWMLLKVRRCWMLLGVIGLCYSYASVSGVSHANGGNTLLFMAAVVCPVFIFAHFLLINGCCCVYRPRPQVTIQITRFTAKFSLPPLLLDKSSLPKIYIEYMCMVKTKTYIKTGDTTRLCGRTVNSYGSYLVNRKWFSRAEKINK